MATERETLPVAEARAGDAAAWDALFRRYQLPLYVYVFELLRDEQASLDLVQESFISAVRHLGGLRDDGKFGSWLFGIAHQKCVQHWRRNQRSPWVHEELAEEPIDDAETPCEMLIREEQEAALMSLLAQLPPPQRSVLLLHFHRRVFARRDRGDHRGAAGDSKVAPPLREARVEKIARGTNMKTPRQILFQQHQRAVPRLDRLRREVLRSMTNRAAVRREPDAGWRTLWRELICPCRRVWAGFAVVWAALLVINFGTSEEPASAPRLPPAEVAAALEQRQRLLAELFPPLPEEPAESPPQSPPQALGRRKIISKFA